ncbi:MAG: flavin reductase [Candidatus Thermoplasmatota archaeon]|nr:flavin reductase [Candidatus Thermoplasmatota archaeon]
MDIDERRKVVSRYLRRCVTYSDASIARKQSRGEDSGEIARWQAFREFTAYSASEMESGALDTWLTDEEGDPSGPPNIGGPSYKIDIESLSHSERREWLASLLMPKPVVLVGTKSVSGIENIAPMSSISVVSNSPPLLVLSLSANREGRPRDTLVNLQESGIGSSASIFILNAELESADAVNKTTKNVSRNQSEWDFLPESPPNYDSALCSIKCRVVDFYPLPEGAVGTLVILRVEEIEAPEGIDSESIPAKLFQIGFDKLGPGPSDLDWRSQIDYV